MSKQHIRSVFVIATAIVALTAGALFLNGRMVWGASEGFCVWFGAAVGPLTSQCLLDPYSFTHILHGFLFFFLLWLVARKLPVSTRLLIAMAFEGGWEILENTNFILNSIGDILAMVIGFLLAAALPVVLGVVAFLITEVFLLWWIRDSLLLQIIALIYPFEFIRNWQNGVWSIS